MQGTNMKKEYAVSHFRNWVLGKERYKTFLFNGSVKCRE